MKSPTVGASAFPLGAQAKRMGTGQKVAGRKSHKSFGLSQTLGDQ